MTVAELLKILEGLPADTEVFTESYEMDGDYVGTVAAHHHEGCLFIVPEDNTLPPETRVL